jgi:FixJ family two-component response regulator
LRRRTLFSPAAASTYHAVSSSTSLFEAEIQALRNSYASLTQRERQVMELVVAGLLNKQVGNGLGISEITVKAHRGKVMQKKSSDEYLRLRLRVLEVRGISIRLTPTGGRE